MPPKTPYQASVERTRRILEKQFSLRTIAHAWDIELAGVLEVDVPANAIADLRSFWDAVTASTPFPDGPGPWEPHPAWGDQSYGIGHTRTFVRILVDSGVRPRRREAVADWIANMQQPTGRFACEEEFQRLYREREPASAAKRAWPHSDLEDAWNALDTLSALGSAPRDRAATVAWLQSLQQPDGSFRPEITLDARGEPYGNPLLDTLHAVRALKGLESAPRDPDQCIVWLLGLEIGAAILPRWALAESLLALDALRMWVDSKTLEQQDELVFSLAENAPLVSFEAYAAIRTTQILACDDEA